ncbi:MAG: DUF1080 domain-containing protein [Acidimicrobiia bacterium]|nr:DUF1080 domain-containing protein [Acidimicrobiia bacterium]
MEKHNPVSRREFVAGLGAAVVGTSIAPSAIVHALQAKPSIRLFNGKDLSGWYSHIRGLGRNNDEKRVYRVTDGMLHVTGEMNGGLMTEQAYGNYRLVVEYRWTDRGMAAPRTGQAKDCGLLIHCGKEDAVAVGTWPQSIQCQIYQGAVGDLVLLPGTDHLSAMIEGDERPGGFQYVPGAKAQLRQAGGDTRFNINTHLNKDPNWKNVTDFRSPNGAERPHGEWNTVEVIADHDTLTFIVNGRTVNKATNLTVTTNGTKGPYTSGAIGIQSEGGEILFRRFELFPLR